MADLSSVLDFLDEVAPDQADAAGAGFKSPPMPSVAHPEGRVYVVPSPTAVDGVRLTALADMTVKVVRGGDVSKTDVVRLRLDDREEREFMEMCLGTAYQEMIDDGCHWTQMKRLGMYAFIYFGIGPEAAEQAREKGLLRGKADAPTPNRAARRQTKKPTSGASRASSTRSQTKS